MPFFSEMSSRSRNLVNLAIQTVTEEKDKEPISDLEYPKSTERKTAKGNLNNVENIVYDAELLGDEVLICESEPSPTVKNLTCISSDSVIDIKSCVIVTADGIILNDDFVKSDNELVSLQYLEKNVQEVDVHHYLENNTEVSIIRETQCDENKDPNKMEQTINLDQVLPNQNYLTVTIYKPLIEDIDQEANKLHTGQKPENKDDLRDVTYEPTNDEIIKFEENHNTEFTYNNDGNNEEILIENTPESDEKNKNKRKRSNNSSLWKKATAKRERNLGNEYMNSSGKVYPKKKAQLVDCSKCKLKCNDKVTQEDVERINHSYWKTGSYERQRDFICKYVKKEVVHRRRKNTSSQNPRRNNTYRYYFPGDIQVCKNTFLRCLDISDKTIRVAKGKEVNETSVVSKDGRGKHSPKNKTSEVRKKIVQKHINSFPVMESHYCRSKTKRLYLSSDLNITKMYELYKKKCVEDNITDPVTASVYRKIFCTEYNMGFHRPKKDSCITCEKYKEGDSNAKQNMKETYERHIKNKELSRKRKDHDKEKAITNNSFKSVTFDLQSVLYTPCSEISHYYYALKFCSYNLCIFDQATKDGYSYFWTETDGKRGSDEIGTALFTYLKSLPGTVKHVSLYSDSCGGQNRNRFLAALLLYAVRQLPIEIIDYNFLEPGHTDMEVDSMHSAIETNKKHQRIYTPHEWPTIIRTARRKKPYTVQELSFSDILDLKALKMSLTSQKMSQDRAGNTINWMKIKMLHFKKTSPQSIFVKENHDQEHFSEMPLDAPTAGLQRNKKYTAPLRVSKRNSEMLKPALINSNMPLQQAANQSESIINPELKKKYTEPLPISEKKKKSLINLCRVDAMPAMYHNFYISLPCNSNVIDRLPEPDQEEDYQDVI